MGGSKVPEAEEPREERSAIERLFDGDADPARPEPGKSPSAAPTPETSDA